MALVIDQLERHALYLQRRLVLVPCQEVQLAVQAQDAQWRNNSEPIPVARLTTKGTATSVYVLYATFNSTPKDTVTHVGLFNPQIS
jgi:hypothetical protein